MSREEMETSPTRIPLEDTFPQHFEDTIPLSDGVYVDKGNCAAYLIAILLYQSLFC